MLDIALQAISIEKRWALSNKYSSLYKSLRLSSMLSIEQHIIYAVDTIIECLDMFSIFIVVKYNKHTHPNHYYYTWSLTVAEIRGEKTQRDNIQHNIQHTHKKTLVVSVVQQLFRCKPISKVNDTSNHVEWWRSMIWIER